MNTKELFDTSHTLAAELFEDYEYPWLVLPSLRDLIYKLIEKLSRSENYYLYSEGVLVAKSAVIADSATLLPPAIIGERAEIRCGAFIRGAVIIGEDAVVGNSCEIKNSVLFDRATVPHFNYVGDSVIGYRAHLGAGAITSNVKSDKTLVTVKGEGFSIETGLKKLGAMVGDHAEIGCNSVLNPGCVIGRRTNVYPLSSVRGVIPENSIFKAQNNIVTKNKFKEN